MKRRNPAAANPALAAAIRAVRVPKREPTEDDRPHHRSMSKKVIPGQITIDEALLEVERGQRVEGETPGDVAGSERSAGRE
jgi:hypothetical protein